MRKSLYSKFILAFFLSLTFLSGCARHETAIFRVATAYKESGEHLAYSTPYINGIKTYLKMNDLSHLPFRIKYENTDSMRYTEDQFVDNYHALIGSFNPNHYQFRKMPIITSFSEAKYYEYSEFKTLYPLTPKVEVDMKNLREKLVNVETKDLMLVYSEGAEKAYNVMMSSLINRSFEAYKFSSWMINPYDTYTQYIKTRTNKYFISLLHPHDLNGVIYSFAKKYVNFPFFVSEISAKLFNLPPNYKSTIFPLYVLESTPSYAENDGVIRQKYVQFADETNLNTQTRKLIDNHFAFFKDGYNAMKIIVDVIREKSIEELDHKHLNELLKAYFEGVTFDANYKLINEYLLGN